MYLNENNYTQKYLAKHLGINAARISMHVSKTKFLPDKHQQTLADLFKISLKEFKLLSEGPHWRDE